MSYIFLFVLPSFPFKAGDMVSFALLTSWLNPSCQSLLAQSVLPIKALIASWPSKTFHLSFKLMLLAIVLLIWSSFTSYVMCSPAYQIPARVHNNYKPMFPAFIEGKAINILLDRGADISVMSVDSNLIVPIISFLLMVWIASPLDLLKLNSRCP